MVAQSGARLKVSDPVACVRYDDGLTQEFPLDQLQLADFADSVPWRQVRSQHGRAHYSGAYASATMGGFVVYESRLELARLLPADFDPKIQQIYAQPFRLVARVGGMVRHHVWHRRHLQAASARRRVSAAQLPAAAAGLRDHPGMARTRIRGQAAQHRDIVL